MAFSFADVAVAVLAGGLGTRLRSVVADRPKVLAPVGGRPFLAYLFDRLSSAGIREATLLTGFAADQVHASFGSNFGGLRLAYSRELEPLGTAGALRRALPQLPGKSILLFNGDSYCEVDLTALLAFHERTGASATLTLTQVADSSRYGRVHFDGDRRIERFEEKNGTRESGWINAGVYLLGRELVERIPPDRAVSLEREVLPACVAAGSAFGFPGGRFIDIGTPESYAEAEAFFSASH